MHSPTPLPDTESSLIRNPPPPLQWSHRVTTHPGCPAQTPPSSQEKNRSTNHAIRRAPTAKTSPNTPHWNLTIMSSYRRLNPSSCTTTSSLSDIAGDLRLLSFLISNVVSLINSGHQSRWLSPSRQFSSNKKKTKSKEKNNNDTERKPEEIGRTQNHWPWSPQIHDYEQYQASSSWWTFENRIRTVKKKRKRP